MVSRELLGATLRSAALFALTALLTSRFVLVGHEFLGHGGAAILVGGELVDHRLFLFGGGWVMTRTPTLSPTASLLIALGGLALEVALAIALIWIARRPLRSLALRVAAVLAAGICLVHVGVYLGLGTHYGYGDGLRLHRLLGDARPLIVAVAALLAIGAAGWMATRAADLLRPTFATTSRPRFAAAILVAAALAGALHGSLMLAERALRDDPTYADIMREEAERQAQAVVASLAAEREAAGDPMSAEQQRRKRRALADAARPFPLRVPLYGAIVLAALVGLLRRRPRGTAVHLRSSALVGLLAATAVAIAIVAALHAPWWR